MPDPLQELTAVGVDYDDVVGLLEADGIAKFESSWALVAPNSATDSAQHPLHPNAATPLLHAKAHR
jgi:hypothetical protein